MTAKTEPRKSFSLDPRDILGDGLEDVGPGHAMHGERDRGRMARGCWSFRKALEETAQSNEVSPPTAYHRELIQAKGRLEAEKRAASGPDDSIPANAPHFDMVLGSQPEPHTRVSAETGVLEALTVVMEELDSVGNDTFALMYITLSREFERRYDAKGWCRCVSSIVSKKRRDKDKERPEEGPRT